MKRLMFVRWMLAWFFVLVSSCFLTTAAEARVGGPCSPPVAGKSCQDTVTWSGPQVTAHQCIIERGHCPSDPDDVLCCTPLAEGEVPAASAAAASAENSNTQGAAAAPTTAAPVAAGSGNCSFNGVNDPFCGKSVADLVGKAIQFLLGAAGALFLAMFVYGGAVWLTAGSSDRHEQARKTLLNASAGIVVVILSYTMVNLLVKISDQLGGGQGDTRSVFSQTDESASSAGTGGMGGGLPAAGGAAAAGSRCNASHFITACNTACEDLVIAAAINACKTNCSSYGPSICSAVRSAEECGPGCTAFCNSSPVTRVPLASDFCSAHCPEACAAAFR
jgi:hypothetical protein